MKANELRIGNWVEGIKMENPIRIINDSIAYNYYNERFEIDSIDIKYYKPIPLTEEWLVRFGLKGRKDFVYDSIKGFGVQIRNDKYYAAIIDISGVLYHSTIEIKYVHQLQNIYFALTGQELELKNA